MNVWQMTPEQLELVSLTCPRCKYHGPPKVSRNLNNALAAHCVNCLKWLKWPPQTDLWLAFEAQQHNPPQLTVTTGEYNAEVPPLEGGPQSFVGPISDMVDMCWNIAHEHGWHTTQRSTLERAMLVVTELAELSEAARNGTLDAPSDHIPAFTKAEEEWVDVLIRVFDHSCDDGITPLRLGQAFAAKVEYNRSRPYRHGGKAI